MADTHHINQQLYQSLKETLIFNFFNLSESKQTNDEYKKKTYEHSNS